MLIRTFSQHTTPKHHIVVLRDKTTNNYKCQNLRETTVKNLHDWIFPKVSTLSSLVRLVNVCWRQDRASGNKRKVTETEIFVFVTQERIWAVTVCGSFDLMYKCPFLSSQQPNNFYISNIKLFMLYKFPCEICGFHNREVEDTRRLGS
jgi:hypothetical protein